MMAQIRTGLRAYALEGHSPAGVVEELNRLALSLGAHQMTTLAYVAARPRPRAHRAWSTPATCRRSSARPDGETRSCRVEGGLPLGVVSRGTRYREHEFELPAGSDAPAGHRRRGRGARRGDRRRAGAAARALAGEDDLERVCEAVARGRRPRPAARPTTWRCSPRGWSRCPEAAAHHAGRPTADALAADAAAAAPLAGRARRAARTRSTTSSWPCRRRRRTRSSTPTRPAAATFEVERRPRRTAWSPS